MSTVPLLKIEDLHTYFYSRAKQAFIRSVDGVDIEVMPGQTLGVVGESGSGKSITMLSTMGLITAGPGVVRGKVTFNNGVSSQLLDGLDQYVELDHRDGRIMGVQKDINRWHTRAERNMKGIRGSKISMIFQNPKAAMNPFETIGSQISEMIKLHTGIEDAAEIKTRALHWLEQVKIDSPKLRYNNYPYGLSGGMSQRAMIAMALSSEPSMLIADEPTTGLDATIQSKIVGLMEELKQSLGMTMVLISHDISVITRLSDQVAVMYGGRVMETGPAKTVLNMKSEVSHPYTRALLASVPRSDNVIEGGKLPAIEGEVLDTINTPRGCRFRERCQASHDGIKARCAEAEPALIDTGSGHLVRCWLYET